MKVKSLVSAAALFAVALTASPSWALQTLSDKQMDAVVGGYDLGTFQTTILNIADQQYLDTFNVLNPNFSFGGKVFYMAPPGGPLFQSNVQVLPPGTTATVTFPK